MSATKVNFEFHRYRFLPGNFFLCTSDTLLRYFFHSATYGFLCSTGQKRNSKEPATQVSEHSKNIAQCNKRTFRKTTKNLFCMSHECAYARQHWNSRPQKQRSQIFSILTIEISVFVVVRLNKADNVCGRWWDARHTIASEKLFSGLPESDFCLCSLFTIIGIVLS